MKIKNGFVLKNICGENIVVGEGKENIDFTKLISMNESSAFLWNNIKDKTFDVDMLKDLLVKEYGIDEQTAANDAKSVAQQWIDAGIAE